MNKCTKCEGIGKCWTGDAHLPYVRCDICDGTGIFNPDTLEQRIAALEIRVRRMEAGHEEDDE